VKIQISSVILGVVVACLLLLGAFTFLWIDTGGSKPIFRDQVLPSGKVIKIKSFNLVWGIEHEDRRTNDDQFALEYVSSDANTDSTETIEVFELIRPVSELWGFNKATVSVFPTIHRKGKYYIYVFVRNVTGKWTFSRHESKVFIND